jgi:hypothetical protein
MVGVVLNGIMSALRLTGDIKTVEKMLPGIREMIGELSAAPSAQPPASEGPREEANRDEGVNAEIDHACHGEEPLEGGSQSHTDSEH